ncbi:hypothetical protein D7Y13_05375 [Corallococcus praedator]|uniref:Uncharacterized protein n=1 Tax=Corallococcus praedator TaxID=2316724 RepID=A0ABX9QQI9_9BACT|nr:hypothetical protein D7X74_06830 [Corallococcus sp. CA047B]RKH34139.1 hypothetical protein D7X75_09375 [Corallococcus sp. CA031C]RKI14888.1 hypothetical protein D7Y13_05375 [Corallococcus praedator]
MINACSRARNFKGLLMVVLPPCFNTSRA